VDHHRTLVTVLAVSAALALMIQISPFFWGNEHMVLEASERIDKARKSWDKLPMDLAQRVKNVVNAFSIATHQTLKVVGQCCVHFLPNVPTTYAVARELSVCGFQVIRAAAAAEMADALLADEAKERSTKQNAQKRKTARCTS
jgi:hypothetical protein